MGERCKLRQWVWGGAPADKRLKLNWCILESKIAAAVAAVFVDFPKYKCNFLHKNKLDIVQFLIRWRLMRSFTLG